MSNDIYLIGEVGCEITLESVIDLVNATDKTKPVDAYIHSIGGDVYEGRAIYNYLKNLDQGVNTYAVGIVASIATIIMLTGKNKVAYNQNNVLIHMPSTFGGGTADDFESVAKDLREEEDKLASIYVEETGLSKEEAIALMREDRMMTNEEIEKFGLTIKKYKAVAKLGTKTELINKMENNKEQLTKEEQGLFAKLMKKSGLTDLLTGKTTPKSIIVKTAAQDEINFTPIEEGDHPQVGDTATVNGQTPEDGKEYIISELLSYTFTGSTLSEIIEKDIEEITKVATVDNTSALEAEISSLKEQLSAKATLETTIINKTKEFDDLNEKYNTIVNKLSGLGSTEVVETKQEQQKEINNKKETMSERLERLSKEKNK